MGSNPAKEAHDKPTAAPELKKQTPDQEDQAKNGRIEEPTYKERTALVRKIRKLINTKAGELNATVDILKHSIGLEGMQTTDDINFLVDNQGTEYVVQLSRELYRKDTGWQREADFVCQRLLTHYSPPLSAANTLLPPADWTHLTQLDLTGQTLTAPEHLKALHQLININANLTSVELGYTGLDDHAFSATVPRVAKLQALTYLGLKGNRLHKESVGVLAEALNNAENFPRLMWVDLQNNVDIFTLSKTFLQQLKSRWSQTGFQPSFRDLADGKALIMEDVIDINL